MTRTQIIQIDQKKTLSIENLESDGLLFLAPIDTQHRTQQFQIKIPWFTFNLLYSGAPTKTAPPRLVKSTSYILEAATNEATDVGIILIKLELLRDVLGQTTFKLSDLFSLHPNVTDLELTIPQHLRHALVSKQMGQLTHQEFCYELMNLTDEYCAAVGPENDKFPDAWIVTYPPQGVRRHMLFVQSKRRKSVGTAVMPEEALKAEHDKVPKHFNHTFIFITDNKERTDFPCNSNEIVITSNQHDQFYGQCLALRKHHMM